jgi:hypothetical protein
MFLDRGVLDMSELFRKEAVEAHRTAQQGGIVRRLFVEEGRMVSAGAPLAAFRVSPSLANGDGRRNCAGGQPSTG